MSKSIQFTLNGDPAEATCRGDMTVLEWLRGEALLRGTKEGCAEGDCGACSVLVMRKSVEDEAQYRPVNSCIMLMGQLEGCALMTVEGLASSAEGGHAVQERMAENGSSQCGFCTPGIVAALAGLLESNGNPQDDDIHEALAGNLCRCTGYRPIVEAAKAAASGHAAMLAGSISAPGAVVGHGAEFYHPTCLNELFALRAEHPDATLLAGGTDIALDVAHARARWPKTILTREVSELRGIETSDTQLSFGAAVTWSEMLPHVEARWQSFATMLRRFGSVQIRNMGTIGGNLGTASPIGDGAPSLLALDAHLTLAGPSGERDIPLDDFFLDYRQSALQDDEIIRAIHIPLPSKSQQFRVYKISKRYDQDISTVCGAFAIEMSGASVSRARIAYGGMAATPMRCKPAEQALAGQPLNDATIASAKAAIRETFTPMTDMRGSAAYRAMVAANLLDRLALDLAGETVEVMAV